MKKCTWCGLERLIELLVREADWWLCNDEAACSARSLDAMKAAEPTGRIYERRTKRGRKFSTPRRPWALDAFSGLWFFRHRVDAVAFAAKHSIVLESEANPRRWAVPS